ncbi:MAG: penicillin-binding protein 2 [Bacteroidales bacterium]|nr:penicillin-binding protein 2 [Bacteroidales bacterium]MBN2819246.1 penicillin-binding protein 2 [Bacteroidales bacterium]
MDQFANRKIYVGIFILLIGLIFTFRLLYLQVIDSTYKLSAESNSRRLEIVYPARGLIYDRNNLLIVHNQPSYDLKISPFELEAFDSTELCEILNVDIQTLRDAIYRVKKYERERRNPFIKQLSPETFGKLKEKQYKFPGFYFSERTLRKYNYEIASHLLGYIGEVDSSIIKKDSYYELGDYYGVSGVESTYENFLKGEKGRRYKLIDVRGKEQGTYREGRYDSDAEMGKNITLTIDAELQQYAEKLMKNFEGSVVAIEPSTGEVLALVSAPFYNPSLLVGRVRQENYEALKKDSLEPLFNNATMALYPPGSTFKTANALVALQEGVIRPTSSFGCTLGYYARGVSMKCHSHKQPLELVEAITNSCNAYFAHTYKRTIDNQNFETTEDAYNAWRDMILSFGFGEPLGIDLPSEKAGFIPKSSYYDRYYGKGYWKAHTIISNAIGQGEILTTPLQIANFAATIANRGYYITPHVVKDIEGVDTLSREFMQKNWMKPDTSYINYIIDGMDGAVNGEGGTAHIAHLKDIVICGKTGTAQNPHGTDHSVFMAFAPKENPRIAISVYVEYGEWGATYGAPIASLLIEKYLTDTIAPNRKWVETRMLNSKPTNKKEDEKKY